MSNFYKKQYNLYIIVYVIAQKVNSGVGKIYSSKIGYIAQREGRGAGAQGWAVGGGRAFE